MSRIKDYEAKSKLEILKKSSKTGDRLTAISDLQDNEERVLFRAGKKATPSKDFTASLHALNTPKIFLSQGTKKLPPFCDFDFVVYQQLLFLGHTILQNMSSIQTGFSDGSIPCSFIWTAISKR